MSDVKADSTLDTKGLSCPMPVLKTKKAIDAVEVGQILAVHSTDKGSTADIPALVDRLGHELVDQEEADGVFSFYIKKLK